MKKTSELKGNKLYYWAAMAVDNTWPRYKENDNYLYCCDCVKLMEDFKICLHYYTHSHQWEAYVPSCNRITYGGTVQEAVCRAVVYSVYGDYVDD